MATKAKNTAGKSSLPKELETLFTHGFAALEAGKGEEASKSFEGLCKMAADAGNVALERVARGYRDLAKVRLQKPKKESGDPLVDLQILLNEGESEAAVEKAEKALKGHGDQAPLHYLRATALAQMGRYEESSQSLAKAVEINKDLLWVYFLEPDFAKARANASFSVFETMV